MKASSASDLINSMLTSDLSLLSVRLAVLDEHGVIGHGTAFLAKAETEYFLVSALHNYTGIHAFDGGLLVPNRRPISLEAEFLHSGESSNEIRFGTAKLSIPLYSNELRHPNWQVSPKFRDEVDVGAIRLPSDKVGEIRHPKILELSRISPSNHKVGSRIAVIGFPDGLKTYLGLPIWKQGYIATEPHNPLSLNSLSPSANTEVFLPAFLLDMLGRSGLSGAPVVFEYEGPAYRGVGEGNLELNRIYNPQDVAVESSRPWTRHTSVVGINTGRIPARTGDAPLCICYGVDEIYEICIGGVTGRHPHN